MEPRNHFHVNVGDWIIAALAVAFAAFLGADDARPATLPATPATFDAVVAKAAAGDVVSLQAAVYGDLYVKRTVPLGLNFETGAVARSLKIVSSPGLAVTNIALAFLPNAGTATSSCALEITQSQKVSVIGGTIAGGPAVSGVPESATSLDSTGNVIGYPTGRGACISWSGFTTLRGLEVSKFHKGVFINTSDDTTLDRLDVHDMRTTAIVCAQVNRLTVSNSYLHDAHPWAWGKTLPGSSATYGDHADFFACWSNSGQVAANDQVRILDNRMEQTAGEAILGMWLQGKPTAFANCEVSRNRFVLNNLQGVSLFDTHDCVVADNKMYRASAGDAKQSPTVLLRAGATITTRIKVSGNLLGAPVDDQSLGVNVLTANTVVAGDANIWAPAPPTPPPVTPPPVVTPPLTPPPALAVTLLPGQVLTVQAPQP
jgi:hypothetical protein